MRWSKKKKKSLFKIKSKDVNSVEIQKKNSLFYIFNDIVWDYTISLIHLFVWIHVLFQELLSTCFWCSSLVFIKLVFLLRFFFSWFIILFSFLFFFFQFVLKLNKVFRTFDSDLWLLYDKRFLRSFERKFYFENHSLFS